MPIEGDRVVRVPGGPRFLSPWDAGLTGVVLEVMGEICVVKYDDVPGQVWFRHQDWLVVLSEKEVRGGRSNPS